MNHDLIERYIYAVTKRMDRKQRQDVALELHGLIEDMLTERCGTLPPSEKDIRVVLTELGTPQELYSQYAEDAKKCLIGQPYYSTYLFVLKIVLISVTVGITLANVILQILDPQTWGTVSLGWLANLYNALLASFAIVTILFAFFYHKGIQITEPFNFDNLPAVPKNSKETSKWESIAGIGFCVIFVVLFLFTPEVFCVIHDEKMVSLFDIEAIYDTWFIILAFAACGIGREAVQLMEGQYNKKVMVTALVSDTVSAVLSIWWLVGYDLMNQTFLQNMKEIFSGEGTLLYGMFRNFDLFFLGVLLFALTLDAIDVTIRTLRN